MQANKFPYIYETVYGDGDPKSDISKQDGKLNSALLRYVICEVFKDKDNEALTEQPGWRVRITDQHDDEETPHFVLDFGNKETKIPDTAKGVSAAVHNNRRRYCDNHSSGTTIEQAMGNIRVTVYLEGNNPEIFADPANKPCTNLHDDAYDKSSLIICYYCHEALPEYFPSYFINIFRNNE
ncbi:hypothetical protein FWH09_01285 [Candidatus Saccharibacteria bacterium]|nr:hypothetical protein [Candidatus Saccharibacteria bacterium]